MLIIVTILYKLFALELLFTKNILLIYFRRQSLAKCPERTTLRISLVVNYQTVTV